MSSPRHDGGEAAVKLGPHQDESNRTSQSSTQTEKTMVDPTFITSNDPRKDENVASPMLAAPDRSEESRPTTPEVVTCDNSNHEPTTTNTPPSTATVLQSKVNQHATALILAVLAILLLGFSIWFIYLEFISEKLVPKQLQLSTGHTITLINILSHFNAFLVALLLDSAYEALRWSLASRHKGVSITTFLALSRATCFLGVADLLRVRGWHQFLCVLRLLSKALCWCLGVVLFLNVDYAMIYTPDGSSLLSIIASVTPINAYSFAPPSVIGIYFQIYAKEILMDVALVKSIKPLTCSGPDCTSSFLPGGLDLVRLASGGPDVTLFSGSTENGSTAFIVNNAPGYHLEFFPVPVGYVFNQAEDCTTYGSSNDEPINICISVEETQMYAGWSVCPSNLFIYGHSLNDTSWANQPDESTVLNIQKRRATVAYDLNNFSILSIESISDPVPATATFISEAVGNFTHIFSLAFSPIPKTFNTSDPNFPTYATAWGDYSLLSWTLRLYQDDYRSYPGSPLDVLKSFLTIPIQFSTTLWQKASWSTLPSDLNTTGTYATSSPRVLGKLWMLIAFATLAGSLVLSSVIALLWVVIFGPLAPNSSRWPEIDTLARSRIATTPNSEAEVLENLTTQDLESFARRNGLANGTSGAVRACICGQRVYVGEVGGAVVLALRGQSVGTLEAKRAYL